MDRLSITPIRARWVGASIILTDAAGDRLPINMPNAGDAEFYAIGLNHCFRRARRAGE